MAQRGRCVPQRSEADRQNMIAELRRWRQLGYELSNDGHCQAEQRRIEGVLRLDWDHGWPEGKSVRVDPCPTVDLP